MERDGGTKRGREEKGREGEGNVKEKEGRERGRERGKEEGVERLPSAVCDTLNTLTIIP